MATELHVVPPQSELARADARPPAYTKLPPADLATAIHDAESLRAQVYDREIRPLLERYMQPLDNEITAMRAHLESILIERKAKALPHEDLEVTFECTERIDPRIPVLLRLQNLVTAEDLSKGLSAQVTVSATLDQLEAIQKTLGEFIAASNIDVDYKSNATHLKPLGRKYGTEIQAILDEGLPKVAIGKPRLTIRPKPVKEAVLKNVTPIGAIGTGEAS